MDDEDKSACRDLVAADDCAPSDGRADGRVRRAKSAPSQRPAQVAFRGL